MSDFESMDAGNASPEKANIGKRLAFIINGEVWIAPKIHVEIVDGRAAIMGYKIQNLVNRLMKRINR